MKKLVKYKHVVGLLVVITLLSLCMFGCKGKEDKKPKEKDNVVSEEQKTEDKEVTTWEDEAEQSIYVDLEKVPNVSENGNRYGFDENYLGYYTNGYFGMHLKQIDGESLKIDIYFCDYYWTDMCAAIMDEKTFNYMYFYEGGMDSTVLQNGIYNSQSNKFDTNIEMKEDGSFCLDNTAQFTNVCQQNWGELMMELYDLQKTGIFEYAFGTYVKQELPKGKMLNSWNLHYSDVYNSGCYYQNTQPLKNRISVDNYPKYIKYIPTEEYYIWGGDPLKKENFIIMQVFTGEGSGDSNGRNVFNKVVAKFNAFYYEEARNSWYNGVYGQTMESVDSDVNKIVYQDGTYADWDTYTFGFYNLNYEIPELLGLSDGSCDPLVDGYEKADTDKFGNGSNGVLQQRHIVMDTTKVNEGIITINNDFLEITFDVLKSNHRQFDGIPEKFDYHTIYSAETNGAMTFTKLTKEEYTELLTNAGIDMTIVK